MINVNTFIDWLIESQEPSGEFKTYAIDCDGNSFYIGESPFATAHVLCMLHDINNEALEPLKKKGIQFLQNLDTHNLGLYKFWYKNTFGTAFANLPFDLDDTAVVNQALHLYGKPIINPRLISKNTNKDGKLFTWWKPSLQFLLKNGLKNGKALFEHYKSYLVFLARQNGQNMAEYNDSELTVRLNIYTLFEMLNTPYQLNEVNIPTQPNEVMELLDESLHYMNPSIYYYALSNFCKYSNKVDSQKLIVDLSGMIKEYDEIYQGNSSDICLLLLSLSNLRSLNSEEVSKFYDNIEKYNNNKSNIMICVGNKKFANYHQYYSPAFSLAVFASLLHKI